MPCGPQAAAWQHVTICGTPGRISIETPFDATVLDDAITNLRTIDALIASTPSGRFEQP